MSRRKHARDFYLRVLGRIPGRDAITALVEEIRAAEQRGRSEAFAHTKQIGFLELSIAEQLDQMGDITPSDCLAQPAEHVAEHGGAAAAPGGS